MGDVPYSWVVYVSLRWEDGSVPTNQQISQIRAYETYGDAKTDLCAAGLGDNGICTLNFGRESFYPSRENPTLTIEVYDTSGVLIFTSDEIADVVNESTVDIAVAEDNGETWTVSGAVTDTVGGAVTEGTVKAYDIYHNPHRELGSHTLSGENTYEISYTEVAFGKNSEHTAPELEVRVFNTDGEQIGAAGTSTPAQNQTLDVVIGTWSITGDVLKSCGAALGGGIIKAVDTRDDADVIIAQTETDSGGAFAVTFTKEAFQVNGATHGAPDLQIWVYDATGETLLGMSAVYESIDYREDIQIRLSAQNGDNLYCVSGKVANAIGLSVTGVEVRAVHLGCVDGSIGEVFLGSAASDGQGDYRICYDPQTVTSDGGACSTAAGQINLVVSAVETVTSGGVEELVTLASSELIFNAGQNETVDLTVDKAASSSGSEYTRLDEALSACLGDTDDAKWESLNRLNESSQYLSFVAQVLDLAETQIRIYVKAWLISGEINARVGNLLSEPMTPEIIYGLIRLGLGDYLDKLRTQTPQTVYAAIVQAISDGIVSRDTESQLYPTSSESNDGLMDDWKAMLAGLMSFSSGSGGTGSGSDGSSGSGSNASWQAQLFALIFGDDDTLKSKVYAAYLDHQGVFSEFCDALRWDEEVSGIEDLETRSTIADNFKFVFELYEQADNWVPIVKALWNAKESRGWEEVQDLVEMESDDYYLDGGVSVAGWLTYVRNSLSFSVGEVPDDVPGKTDQERRAVYATRLFKSFCKTFPETRFRILLNRVLILSADFTADHPDFEPPSQDLDAYVDTYIKDNSISIEEAELGLLKTGLKIRGMSEVNTFLKTYPDFDLAVGNIDTFASENGLDKDALADTLTNIKKLQRVYRIAPDFESAAGLIYLGYDNAYKIARLNEDNFVADYESYLGGLTNARKIHRTASRFASDILALLVKYKKSLNETGDGDALPDGIDTDKLYDCYNNELVDQDEAESTDRFPNWITLFGDLNKCACEHCQTVFSAGAYMVDLLEFLEGEAKEILLTRRPDLSDVELTCPNTNKTLPYIDLVNEVLESVVEPLDFTLSEISKDTLEKAVDDESAEQESSIAQIAAAFLNDEDETTGEKRGSYVLTERAKYKNSPCGTSAAPEWIIEEDAWRFTVREEDGKIRVYPVPQTSRGNDSLEVYPEHLNQRAYDVLKDAIFPFNLPLDLGKEEINIFLKHKESPRHEILETFSEKTFAESLADEADALAYLNLSESEAAAVLGTTEGRDDWEYWGFDDGSSDITIYRPDKPTLEITGTWVNLSAQVPVFMHRTGLSYMEIVELLDTAFVHDTDHETHLLHIAGTEDDIALCNYNNFQIAHLNDRSLKRISFFVRLWRKLGWTMRELDRYLMSRESGSIPSDLISLSQFKRLTDTLDVSVLTALSWWDDIDTRRTDEIEKSFFDEVFLIGSQDEPEYQKLRAVSDGGDNKIDISDEEMEFIPALRAALGVTEDEFLLIRDNELGESTVELDLSALSALYRVASFCDAVGVSIEEYYETLPNMEGFEPFGGNIVQMFTAIDKIAEIKNSGLSTDEINYLFRNISTPGDSFLLTDDDVTAAQERIAAGILEIETAFPREETASLEGLTTRLGLLMPADKTARVIEIIQGPESATDDESSTEESSTEESSTEESSTEESSTEESSTEESSTEESSTDESSLTDEEVSNALFAQQYIGDFLTLITAGEDSETGETVYELTEAGERLIKYNTSIVADSSSVVNGGTALTREMDLQERYDLVWEALIPYLIEQKRNALAVDIPADLSGLDRDQADKLVNGYLTPTDSEADEGAFAIWDWKKMLGGGWSVGSGVLEDVSAEGFEASALLTAPKDGDYVFVMELAPSENNVFPTPGYITLDGVSLTLTQSDDSTDELSIIKSSSVSLKNKTSYDIEIACDGEGTFSFKWEINKENRVTVPQTATMDFLSDAYDHLHRAAYLIDALKLESVELDYLQERGLLNLDGIAAGTVTWPGFTPVLEALSLNRNIGLTEGVLFELWPELTSELDDEMSEEEKLAARTARFEKTAELTDWNEEDIRFVRSLLGEPAWDDVAFWQKLSACTGAARKLKLSAEKIYNKLVDAEPSLTTAASLRNLFKSQYSKKSWSDAFKPLRDALRQKQRDALTGYLCSRPIEVGDTVHNFFNENDLYSYFLIDVEMEPDMQTSRIVLANSSIQLLVQRIFLGLESEAAFRQLDKVQDQWKWMKNYRVWEANRKVFLYPENWIEPELRDDKSEFFSQLEDELSQEELTDERAQNLLSTYLEKLGEVSGLEVVGSFAESAYSSGVNQILHVVARTRNQPRTYYYRRLINKQYTDGQWEPWVKIGLELSADTVMPAIFNGRVFLVWPTYQSKQTPGETMPSVDANSSSVSLGGTQYCTEIRINWSEYLPDRNKWSKPRVSKGAGYDYNVLAPHQRTPGNETPRGTEYHMQIMERHDTYFEVGIYRAPYPPLNDGYGQQKLCLIGQFSVWYNSDDSFSQNEDASKYDIALSNGFFQGAALLSSAADQTGTPVNGQYAGPALQFLNCEPLFRRTPETYRICSTNFDFVGEQRFDPFFFQTQSKTLFVLNKGYIDSVGANGLPGQRTAMSTFHHPLVRDIQQRFLEDGPDGIMTRTVQALPIADNRYYSNYYYNYYGSLFLGYHISGDAQAWDVAHRMFKSEHHPDKQCVEMPLPLPTVEFGYGTPFGLYNWELFFHIPMLIANRFSQEMRFEDAMNWYHYIFDPKLDLTTYEKTKSWVDDLPTGCRYWQFLPFFSNKDATTSLSQELGLDDTMSEADSRALSTLIDAWREDPFKPHLIARYRTVAYQKAVVMKYLDNLIDWADQLFRADSMESINEATQLYVMAAELMGQRPEKLPPITEEVKYTYRELQAMGLDDFSNAIVEVEDLLIGNQNYIKNTGDDGETSDTKQLATIAVNMFYFHVPMNEKLTSYWDTIEDRLFKIRNSMNIDGVKRQLSLFQPPIDPAMLVRAAAAGIDLSSVLQQMNAPLPYYRFSVWMQKATELCNEVKSFGAAVLSALEKKDAEELQLLRSTHEIKMLELIKSVKNYQIEEATRTIEGLERTRALAEERYNEYRSREKINKKEQQHMTLMTWAASLESSQQNMRSLAGVLSLIPEIDFGAITPLPRVGTSFGGKQLSAVKNAEADSVGAEAAETRGRAGQSQTMASYERRWEDWKLQERLAKKEMEQIDKQILGAKIRLQIAEKELGNHETQIEQATEQKEFMEEKFTNKELYRWMITQLSRTYQDVYKLAYDTAKTAEKTYQFELGLTGTEFIKFGYMDSLKKGLLAGEQLILDLKRMDISYLEKNKRELEITKPISLRTINPEALQALRDGGACEIAVPEVLFDLDFPGQYFRRIKTVRVTIPCVTGPNVGVSAKLSLLRSAIRKSSTADSDDYAYKGIDDTRFVHDLVGIQSIATSTAQNDSGLFELNFKDERYLPFEGAGAISLWRLELPSTDFSQFDYNTISDVILNISYTAREAGGTLKVGAENSIRESLNKITDLFASDDSADPSGLTRYISLKKEFPNLLYQLLTPSDDATEGSATLTLLPEHFPYVWRNRWPMNVSIDVSIIDSSVSESTGKVTYTPSDAFELGADWESKEIVLTQSNLDKDDVKDVIVKLTVTLDE